MAKSESPAVASEAASAGDKKPKERSPNYPSIHLEEAIEKLPKLFADMKRHAVGVESAVASMGLKYTSSSGKLALGAMRAFGLLENSGKGMVKLSQRALDIVSDYPRSAPEWRKAVQDAALSPNAHKKLWERYGADMPADDELRRVLIREMKFYDNAVGPFIAEYKKSIAFSGLAEGGAGENNGQVPPIKVGDYVQWTSGGADQFEAPRKVLEIVNQDGEWALIEGSSTGVPMSELTIQPPPASASQAQIGATKTPPVNTHFKPLPPTLKGPSISFPLPNGNTIEIRLAKPVSKKDFEKIKSLIDLSEDSLVSDDAT